MSTATNYTFDPSVLPPIPVKRWTVEEYHELVRAGLLDEDERYELLEGWLVTKMTRNPPHETAVATLCGLLFKGLPDPYTCRAQGAITLADSEPEPDVAIYPGPQSRYRTHHPGPGELVLVIEVSDGSLARDWGIKLRTYARAGIAEYWIVNLIDHQIEVYREPSAAEPASYAEPEIFSSGTSVPVTVDGQVCLRIAVDEIC
jgi:Uma2 family endonuclease